jgi:hypothetical protein
MLVRVCVCVCVARVRASLRVVIAVVPYGAPVATCEEPSPTRYPWCRRVPWSFCLFVWARARGRSADSLFPAEYSARPYRWAQWLGGLIVLPPNTSGSGRQAAALEPSTRAIVTAVRACVHFCPGLCRSNPA